MNLPEYSLRSAKVIWFFLAVLLAGGALGFATLGKKEDAVFVIKSASLVCSYPGATPQQVEELVTEPIEREVQSMRRVHKITSESYYGLSKIQVELDPATPAAEIPQLWDELRRKVLNVMDLLARFAEKYKALPALAYSRLVRVAVQDPAFGQDHVFTATLLGLAAQYPGVPKILISCADDYTALLARHADALRGAYRFACPPPAALHLADKRPAAPQGCAHRRP